MRVEIEPGTYPIEHGGFTIGATHFLFREREAKNGKANKRPPYYIVANPGGYVSSMFPMGSDRYRIDHTGGDGVERVYYLTFGQRQTYVVITGGEPSKRSGSVAPWRTSKGMR